MHARMGWTISTPGGGRRPRAIVYCLHAMGGNHRMAFDSIRVPQAAASIGFDVAVAAVDGGPDSYWHKRANGTDALAMFLHEFVPLVRSRVGGLPQALMGWSMGGYGALLAAERARREFAAVSPASPALWLTLGATAPGAFDNPADFYANDVFTGVGNLAHLTVAVWCGTGDPFYLATRHLVSLMRFPRQAHFGLGSHGHGYWRKVAVPQLRAIATAPEIVG
jgi:dienelactone hydrolase